MATGYDRDTLYSRLYEVADLAGELRYVDAVLAFIADQTQTPGAGPGGPAHSYVDVNNIGQTYPFSRRIMRGPLYPDYADTVDAFCQAAAEEAATWRDTNLESLLRTVEPVTHPETSHYDEIVRGLETSYLSLSNDPEAGDVRPEGTRSILRTDFGLMDPDQWSGLAASNFRNVFYQPFKYDVRENQAAYTKSVAAGFVRAKALDELAQISLLDAVTATRQVLLEQLQHRQQDTGASSKATALIILAAGTSILAVISAPAAPVSAAMSAISGFLYYAGSEEAAQEARAEESFEGQSADDLFFGLYGMAAKIASNRRGHYDTLAEDMSALLEWAGSNHTENVLIPTRPDIAERNEDDKLDPDLDEFRHRDFHPNA